MKPAFRPEQTVRVLDRPRDGGGGGHVRTPAYLRGHPGRILTVEGSYPDPTALARGELGLPYRMLYRVAFRAEHLWPGYDGPPDDEILADLYEHWLEALEESDVRV